MAEPPDWLLELVRVGERGPSVGRTARQLGPTRGQARLAALARTVCQASEGTRNSVLYWACRRAAEDGIPAPIAASVLTRMAQRAGLDEGEIEATVRSAQEAARR